MQIFYLCLLLLRVVSSVFHFQNKTVHVKQDVELACAYQESSNIFWIRIISGHWPEFLGGKEFPTRSNRISAKQQVLRISEAKLNDTGLYYCVKGNWQHLTFETGYFVKVKETESDISSIIQEPPTVYPGVQTSENTEDLHKQRSHWSSTVLCLICAALIITVIVLIYYICSMKKKTCSSCCYGMRSATDDSQNQQTNGESLVYSTPTFSGRKTGKAERRIARSPKKETIYSDVCVRVTSQEMAT